MASYAVPSDEEVVKLLAAQDQRIGHVLLFCLLSGIRHRCHNRLCINPEHLTIGNRADNKRDDWEYLANGVDFNLL